METYLNSLTDAVRNIEQGDVTSLAAAYCVFGSTEVAWIQRAGRAISRFLDCYNMQQIIRLSETFRQYTSIEWLIDWKNVSLLNIQKQLLTNEDYVSVLLIGSFHPNGFFRENCVNELACQKNTLAFLMLRVNDWVEGIRRNALRYVQQRIETGSIQEILIATPALEKLKRSGRCSQEAVLTVNQLIIKRIWKDANRISLWEVVKMDFSIRKSLYQVLFNQSKVVLGEPVSEISKPSIFTEELKCNKTLLTHQQAEQLLQLEKNSFCQSLIITGILSSYPCDDERLDSYLQHRNASVRRKALDYKYKRKKDIWPGLERMLFDSSYGIRDTAAYLLKRHGNWNIAEYYQKHLAGQYKEIAILGLGENGDKSVAEELMPFLKEETPRIVRNTLLALGKLLHTTGSTIYWNFLTDKRQQVSKAAYQVICANQIQYGSEVLYVSFCQAKRPVVRRYLLFLILREPFWKRLPYLLKLYGKVEENLKQFLLEGMWCTSLYAKISREEEDNIRDLLFAQKKQIPEELLKNILFDLKFVTQN